jgi:hypothetical protein
VACRYLAPEVISLDKETKDKKLDASYGKEADVFSYATLLWELWTLTDPYATNPDPSRHVLNENGRPDIALLKKCPSWLVSLIRGAWAKDTKERLTFKDIVVRSSPCSSSKDLITR